MGTHRATSPRRATVRRRIDIDVTRMLTGVIAAGVLSIPLAGVASAKPPPTNPGTHGDVAVSVNGTDVKTSTNPSTRADSFPRTDPEENSVNNGANVAIARNSSTAIAGPGTSNKARASNFSLAFARNGDNNTATASDGTPPNDLSVAIASGNNRTATATCGGFANAPGDGQTVTNDGGLC